MGKRFNLLLMPVLITAVMIAAGCTAPDASCRARQEAAKHLDPNGSEYNLTGGMVLQQTLKELDTMLVAGALKLPTAAERREFAQKIAIFRLAAEAAGVNSILWSGSSSTRLGSSYFHSRGVIITDPEKPGLLNEYPVKGDLNAKVLIGTLPEGTQAAFYADIQSGFLLKKISQCGDLAAVLLPQLPAGLPLKELLQGNDGLWSLVFLSTDSKNPLFRLTLPDKENRLFNLAAMLARQPDALKKGVAKLSLGAMVTVEKRAGDLAIYLGAECEKRFKDALPINAERLPAEIFYGIPEKLQALAFFDPSRMPENWNDWRLGKYRFPAMGDSKLPEILAVSALPDNQGWQMIINDESSILSGNISFILEMVFPFAAKIGGKKSAVAPKVKRNPPHPEPAHAKARLQERCSCAATLREMGKLSSSDPGFKAGLYRLDSGKLQKVSSGRFDGAYFPAFKDSEKLPMWVSAPHKEGFCVLLKNGDFRSFKLNKPGSFRRIIGFLHTVYKFDEEVFGHLIGFAIAFDRQMR